MMVTMGLQVAVKAPILAVWALVKISDSSVEWTAATSIAVGILIVMFVVILLLAMPKFRRMQALTDDINRVARENLTGLSIVRAYNAEEYQTRKFEKTNQELTYTNMFASRAMAFTIPTIATIMSFITLVIYWIGAYLINDAGAGLQASVLFGNMIVFSSYAMQILLAVMMITMWFIILPRSQVSAKRINEVLDTPISIRNGSLRQGRLGMVGEVEFVNVGFRYSANAEPVLQDISFRARRGETVAFIGSTGSGKTTLINMVPRFYDATSGQVLVNGKDVKEYDSHALYNKIGYISQKAVMFDGSIRSNIAMGSLGKYMIEEDIYRGLDIAQGGEFVSKLPEGIESAVARGGSNFSGGQKQRLSIARAIAKCPEILIFDDSFSALDYKTDKNLRAAIKKSTSDTTVLVVAQRIGTIMDADQIIVLNEGKMVGKGKHKELLETCPVYLEIAKSQLSEEELAR
jgi:ATP-binding cassette subfamily B protein